MPTRFYFSDVASGMVPASWSAGWNSITTDPLANDTLTLEVNRDNDALAGTVRGASGTSGHFTSFFRSISLPLAAQTISGNVSGQFLAAETSAADNYTLAIAIKVVMPDGTDRGVLLAVSASDDVSSSPPELATGLVPTNRSVQDSSENTSIALSSLAVSDGDRLVVEVGIRQGAAATNAGSIVYGAGTVDNPTTGDLPVDSSTTSLAFRPWVEFDATIQFSNSIYHFGSAATPEDLEFDASEPVTAAVTPPLNMRPGDLVVLVGQLSVSSATISMSETGGQTWNTASSSFGDGVDQVAALYWCRFNGTWSASPSLSFPAQSGTQPATAIMHVFRPPTIRHQWSVDVALQNAAFSAPSSPFTVTRAGQTTVAADTVTLAGWLSNDDNSWTSLSGTGWSITGTAQYRNGGGADQSASFAHFVSKTAGEATGSVSKNQAVVTGDGGQTFVITFAAVGQTPDVAMPVMRSPSGGPR